MQNTKLYILWTNADEITSEHMVMMYAKNALLKKWWEEVTVIIWGKPQLLICENEHIRNLVLEAREAGVHFSACIACAKNLGTKEKLDSYGFEIIPWGPPLTDILKSGDKLLTV